MKGDIHLIYSNMTDKKYKRWRVNENGNKVTE